MRWRPSLWIRFLDVWFVAFGFIAFRAAGFGGAPVDRAARYYLCFSLLLVLGLVLVVALRDFLKKICLGVLRAVQ